MVPDEKKAMSAALSFPPLDSVTHALARGLKALPAVDSVHYLPNDNLLTVWVCLQDGYDEASRADVYRFEDQISEQFPMLRFDFHIVAVPAGQKIENYLSNASPIFQRKTA
jgi:hypothetical protein